MTYATSDEIEDAVSQLIGEQIVGGGCDVEGDGIHLYTRNGLVLIFFGLGIYRPNTKLH